MYPKKDVMMLAALVLPMVVYATENDDRCSIVLEETSPETPQSVIGVEVGVNAPLVVSTIEMHNPIIVQVSANVLNVMCAQHNNQQPCSPAYPPVCPPCQPPYGECSGWESCWEFPDSSLYYDVPSSQPQVHTTCCGRDNDPASLAAIIQDDPDEMEYVTNAPAHWSQWKACRAALWSMYLLMHSELLKLRTYITGFCRQK